MTASIEFFPVGSGDMTLIRLASGKTILIDINIRQNADKESEKDYPDVARMLKKRLDRDSEGGLFVDVFMLSHPDRDHISGLRNHFHLGAPSSMDKSEGNEPEKILIREMWSSPLTFRRKDKIDGKLNEDAQAWRDEAKRRVKLFKNDEERAKESGNMIKILGEDVHHKSDGLEDILVKTGEGTSDLCGSADDTFSALLLSPKLVTEEEAEELSGKNNSSIVMRFSLAPESGAEASGFFLTGGDAEINIWKRIWSRNKDALESIQYNILQTPHHCSLGTLSYDKYNDDKKSGQEGKGEDCEIDEEAYKALSQTLDRALIVASTDEPKPKKEGKDLAKREYEQIASDVEGQMFITMRDSSEEPLKIEIFGSGPKKSASPKALEKAPPKVRKGKSEQPYA
ncbi:metallohydrolase [Idiomarina sp. OXR-189]|uniref:metallohydrolase n=1 Tax=Idiomarina sp. OXR-189 TaxID=3100175 RepID=UPI002AC932D8|nr:metallohydrolase [Idiomarina sp. OXR-189]WPZ01528.1 metallohydrolase [Idiomarina sp. OXR-189]